MLDLCPIMLRQQVYKTTSVPYYAHYYAYYYLDHIDLFINNKWFRKVLSTTCRWTNIYDFDFIIENETESTKTTMLHLIP